MKRSPLQRRTPLVRGSSQLKRSPVKPKRSTPRRRPTAQWTFAEWEQANLILMKRSGGVCEWCGKQDCGPFERHHRKRRRDGGDSLQNIILVGAGCHHFAHEHPAFARKYGLIVSVNRDPAEIPFLHARREWVYLNEDGTKSAAFPLDDDAHA